MARLAVYCPYKASYISRSNRAGGKSSIASGSHSRISTRFLRTVAGLDGVLAVAQLVASFSASVRRLRSGAGVMESLTHIARHERHHEAGGRYGQQDPLSTDAVPAEKFPHDDEEHHVGTGAERS